MVIVLGRDFKRHTVVDGNVRSGSGVALAVLVQEAFNIGLTGFEFAVGIPGTLGGALAMNAGSRDAWIGDVVESVTLFTPGRGLVALRGSEVSWGYRRTDLPGRGIIVEIVAAAAAWRPRRDKADDGGEPPTSQADSAARNAERGERVRQSRR